MSFDKFLILCVAVLIILAAFAAVKIRADEQEVAPYRFADLPHGRIYKVVQQGCELFIVESDVQLPSGQYGVLSYPQHSYAVATGRGCR